MRFSVRTTTQSGIATIEILLIIAAFTVLGAIALVIWSEKQEPVKLRDAQRRKDVVEILNAVSRYADDHDGYVPIDWYETPDCAIQAETEICRPGGSCKGLVDLKSTLLSPRYLPTAPLDPTAATKNGTGYRLVHGPEGHFTVCAPATESGEMIRVSR